MNRLKVLNPESSKGYFTKVLGRAIERMLENPSLPSEIACKIARNEITEGIKKEDKQTVLDLRA